ncbi:hypothetical protein F2Q70_00021631 [Brassica cretica]|uniref:Uncharacterized protein n=2 Tax=Brassica cretica TaxID=69181 RepID=A0A3N6TIR6_BRACR|nr:hypothetical protein F2Q70_00021631 [Brassica cretica]KAF2554934.1 hypothetical protein F2Q68_00015306 [Brassica cretica]KAF3612268.1 hypothetical protein DY000_02047974 [Brassica cretica]
MRALPAQSMETPRSSSTSSLASIIQRYAQLAELNTPSQNISLAPFVLILDENIAEAKEEFKEFLFARFSGDVPPKGRIIGATNMDDSWVAGSHMFIAPWSLKFSYQDPQLTTTIVLVKLRGYLMYCSVERESQ